MIWYASTTLVAFLRRTRLQSQGWIECIRAHGRVVKVGCFSSVQSWKPVTCVKKTTRITKGLRTFIFTEHSLILGNSKVAKFRWVSFRSRYMKLCVPVRPIEGPNSWETALMEETPTLLPSLKCESERSKNCQNQMGQFCLVLSDHNFSALNLKDCKTCQNLTKWYPGFTISSLGTRTSVAPQIPCPCWSRQRVHLEVGGPSAWFDMLAPSRRTLLSLTRFPVLYRFTASWFNQTPIQACFETKVCALRTLGWVVKIQHEMRRVFFGETKNFDRNRPKQKNYLKYLELWFVEEKTQSKWPEYAVKVEVSVV